MIVEASFESAGCPRCKGTGQAETCFQSGVFECCPYCKGAGVSPHRRCFAYSVEGEVEVGDRIITPASEYMAGGEAEVVRLGSTYSGPVKHATRA